MTIYTYEVDHGEESPEVFAGMKLNGGKVQAVQFDAGLAKLEKAEEALADIDRESHDPEAVHEILKKYYGS